MKKILILLLFCPLQLFSQTQTVSLDQEGKRTRVTFDLVGLDDIDTVSVPFRAFLAAAVEPDTSLISPALAWLEGGTWNIAMKVAEVVAGDADSFSVWMKPLLVGGKVSYNDSTFIKMNAQNPDSYVSSTVQWFDPITATETWYTSVLTDEIWGFAGVVFYVRQLSTGTAATKSRVTLDIYRFR